MNRHYEYYVQQSFSVLGVLQNIFNALLIIILFFFILLIITIITNSADKVSAVKRHHFLLMLRSQRALMRVRIEVLYGNQ